MSYCYYVLFRYYVLNIIFVNMMEKRITAQSDYKFKFSWFLYLLFI